MSIIQEIINREWEFFQETNNIGGRASCQDNNCVFTANRESQFSAWPKECLESYLQDLKDAQSIGRNLVAEKYLRMMENSMPEIFELEKNYLCELEGEELDLIDKICDMQIEWQNEFAKVYPYISKFGRPIESQNEAMGMTSVKTYLAAELKTYSINTCRLLYRYCQQLKDEGKNLSMMITEHLVQLYNYGSLDAAEEAHRAVFNK